MLLSLFWGWHRFAWNFLCRIFILFYVWRYFLIRFPIDNFVSFLRARIRLFSIVGDPYFGREKERITGRMNMYYSWFFSGLFVLRFFHEWLRCVRNRVHLISQFCSFYFHWNEVTWELLNMYPWMSSFLFQFRIYFSFFVLLLPWKLNVTDLSVNNFTFLFSIYALTYILYNYSYYLGIKSRNIEREIL